MANEERKAFERRLIEEVWNKGNLGFAEECLTSDYVYHDPASPEEIRGPEGFKQNVAGVRSAFPDFQMQIVDQVAEGDRMVTRYVTTGTQEGELTGIPPTGKRVEVAGVGIDYFSGGKIRRQDRGVMGVLRRNGHNAAAGGPPLSGVDQPLPSVIGPELLCFGPLLALFPCPLIHPSAQKWNSTKFA